MADNPIIPHTAERLRVKSILRDGDFYASVALPVLAYFNPHAAHWLVENWPLVAPFALVLAGRLGIRISGAQGTARVAANLVQQHNVFAYGEPSIDPVPTSTIANQPILPRSEV